MKILNYFFFFSFIITMYSCNKNTEIKTADTTNSASLYDMLMAKNINVDGNITLTSSSSIYHKLPAQIDINGYFKDRQGKFVKSDVFKVNQYDMEEQPNLSYHKYFSSKLSDFSNITSSYFGNEAKVEVKSKDFGDISVSMYSPQIVEMQLDPNIMKTLKLDKNKGLTIKWTPDSKLVSRNEGDDKVGAAIIYHAGYSSNLDQSNLPKENVTAFKLANDATGEVTFTPQELANLPKNGNASIYVARANQNIVTSSTGQKVGITSFSLGYSPEIKVQ
jgi:hypothetical protein